MGQNLSDVYANVVDYLSSGRTIQDAIDSGRHVLFPAGIYAFSGTLVFGNAGQWCTFLSGAILQPMDSHSYVLITGTDQAITGLRIEGPDAVPARCPLVEIYGASGILMEDLGVSVTSMAQSVSGPRAAVRVMCLTSCMFIGGAISGNQETGTIGLWLASSYDYDKQDHPNPAPGEWIDERSATKGASSSANGANDVGAVGLRIEAFGWAVRVGSTCESPGFTDCIFADNVDGALVVRDDADVVPPGFAALTTAAGLTLVGCQMSGAAPGEYIHVEGATSAVGGAAINGGVVVGCSFGATEVTVPAPGAGSPVPPGATVVPPSTQNVARSGDGRAVAGEDVSDDVGDCIFLIDGNICGVVVSGCRSASPARSHVWSISGTGVVTASCDIFNSWAESSVAGGTHAGQLARMTAHWGELIVEADEVCFDAAKIAFGVGAVPATRAPWDGYRAPGTQHSGDRSLTRRNVELVLAQLLFDLGDIGLIKQR